MQPNCPDCSAPIGKPHVPGCDIERCPRCGMQKIGCDCVYVVNGLAPHRLEEDHPDIYEDGPTAEMYARWDAEWGPRRLPWTGEFPGVAECREYGWYARFVPGKGWLRCGPDDPDATEDITRLCTSARWDADAGRFVRREGGQR